MLAWIVIAFLVSVANAFCFPASSSFVVTTGTRSRRCHHDVPHHHHHHPPKSTPSSSLVVLSSSSNNDNENNLDAMRRILEASWNTQTMGAVPTNPNVAAAAAAKAIQAAKAAAEGNNATTVCCFVDLLLPQYDIAAGRNVYDEVLAMEFCIGIALALDRDTQSVIYVKDDTSLTSIRRILESRRRSEELSISTMTTSTLRESATTNEEDDYEEIQVEIEIEDDTDDESEADLKSALTDKTTNGTGNQSTVDSASDPSSPNTDKDDFRQQLMSAWDNGDVVESPSLIQDKSAEEDTGSTEIPPGKERRTKTIIQRVKKDQRSQPPQVEATTSKNRYRLASMFGTSTISKGTNMPVDVLAALRIHARPGPEEDTMIILSAVSREESMALRSLVASFQSTKTIVLVNCRVEQLPRELSKVETVYSFLPLIAKSGDGANNNNNNNDDPRIVVLRQYPGKWQIHVDVDGTGFQLAKETSNDKFPNKRGPTMDWIANSLKNYLQSIRLKD